MPETPACAGLFRPTSVANSTVLGAGGEGQNTFWQGSPFPGLRPFTDKDWPIFFGRGRETDDLLARLRDPGQRFIAVVGASGSGKSSLVWAGLIPRLMDGALEDSGDWAWVRFTPGEFGDNPFISLAAMLKAGLENTGLSVRELADALQQEPERLDGLLRVALANKPATAEWLLFIDQFEELFTLVNPAHRPAFVRWILALSNTACILVVVSMRADFYPHCVEQGLAELLRTGSYPLAAAGQGALYAMVTRPAALGNLEFEEGLDESILNDVGQEPGALPLLAFALEQLYRERTAEGQLTHAAYQAFGKVQGSIGKRANAVFNGLPPEVQAKFSEVFRELVEVDERGVPTRRRAKLGEILNVGACSEPNAVELATEGRNKPAQAGVSGKLTGQYCRNDGQPLNPKPLSSAGGGRVDPNITTLTTALTKARLLVTDKRENGDEATIEVAHEALFRTWGKLADWVSQTADDQRCGNGA